MTLDILHRPLCDVLRDMRTIIHALGDENYSLKVVLRSLVEEVQIMGNRMEAGLQYGKDLDKLHRKRAEIRKELGGLEEIHRQMKKMDE